MKQLITLIFILLTLNVSAQISDTYDGAVYVMDKKVENKIVRKYKAKKFFENVYKNIFKYATVYVAGDASNAYETPYPDYFIRTNPDDLYAIPQVIDETVYHPFDYRVGFGVRKLARFDYEIKSKNYYDGTENNKALSAPTAAVQGFEYLFHWEKQRERSNVFTNSRYFIRHTGKHHIVKVEQREVGNIDFKYQSAEVRFRLPIGKKLSLSAGVIARTHQKAFGYNPIELWLNELDENGNPANYWYTLGFEYGYTDHFTSYTDINTGNVFYDWIWRNPDGDIVAYGDRDFRDRVFGDLMNRYNQEQWALLDAFAEYAPVVGFDFYHYKNKFWLHSYANWILPYHKYFKGNVDFSYLHRESWGLGGHNNLLKGKQWSDYQGGLIIGWKITKTLGIFMEGEYTKFWDSEIFNTSVGLNVRL
tara:strand:- start:3634 stop:4890 length:1257 start_codon:yes stop_codon:yes gene_type:complete